MIVVIYRRLTSMRPSRQREVNSFGQIPNRCRKDKSHSSATETRLWHSNQGSHCVPEPLTLRKITNTRGETAVIGRRWHGVCVLCGRPRRHGTFTDLAE